MQKRRVFGIALIFLGLVIFFLKPIASITGFAIGESVASAVGLWLYVLGLGMMFGGMVRDQ